MSRRNGLRAYLALAAAAALFSGCASGLDKAEVEQKANPVRAMHQELMKSQEAEKNRPQWYTIGDAFVKGRQDGKFVMVEFYSRNCKYCKQLESETLPDPKVAEALKAGFVLSRLDAESGDKVTYEMRQTTMADLAEKFEVAAYPTILFFDKDGGRCKTLKGYLPPESFLYYLNYIRGGKYKDMEFEDFVKKGG